MKIVTVVGARPQFIKASVVSHALARAGIDEKIVHTGQHFDANMSDAFFDELDIPAPAYHLGIGGGSHGAMTGRMLEAIEKVLLDERPDWVLVYGDTNSTLAGALAAAKLHIPVAHVEAGLRSFNRRMPEEINRVLTDHASDRLYAPTSTAIENLKSEGVQQDKIRLVGDVMYDAALAFGVKPSSILATLGLESGGYILATVHRAENTDHPNRLKAIFEGLSKLDRTVVLPLHPRTAKAIGETATSGNLKVIGPLGFLDMVQLEKNAALIATDSGGVQKEAYFYGVPCVTLRDETEWVELLEAGWNCLCPPASAEAVVAVIGARIGHKGREVQLYGDGNAAKLIANDLLGVRA